MKRTAIGLCVAAAFGFVASSGAQTPPTTTAGQTPAVSSRDAKDISITGCLQRGPDGKFLLTNARMDNDMTHSSSTGTSTGTTGSTAGTTSPAAGSTAGAMGSANTWTLEGGQDLDKHVGHKIQVTGQAAADAAHKDDDAAKGTTSTATGSTATTGTTGAAPAAEQHHDMKNMSQRFDVKSVKMIAASCS